MILATSHIDFRGSEEGCFVNNAALTIELHKKINGVLRIRTEPTSRILMYATHLQKCTKDSTSIL